MQDLINPNAPPESLKKVLFWLKKVIKSSLYGLAIPTCLLRRINQHVDAILERDIPVGLQKTSSRRGIGHVRRCDKMEADDVLKLLEKHEEECNRRYAQIQHQLDKVDSRLDKLDLRLWGIAALIIAAAVAERFI